MVTYGTNNPGTGTTTGSTTSSSYGTAGSTSGSTSPSSRDEQGPSSGITTSIGERLDRAGDYLDEKGKASFLSERLHGAGRYLQDVDPRSMVRSVDGAITNHPYRGILIGLGIGWVVGRFLSGGRE